MLNDLRVAVSFLTIVPLGMPSMDSVGRSFSWYPLVGAAIGLGLMGITLLPLDGQARAWLGVLAWVILTGGLHLDGFGDTCDGLFASVPIERRREIMKDPRTGTWAVVGLILLLLGKFVGVQTLNHPLLWLLPPMLGRWAMVLAVQFFPSNSSGLAAYFRAGFLPRHTVFATGSMLAVLMVLMPFTTANTLWVLPLTLGLTAVIGRVAQQRLGGLNGDVYGFLCETVELMTIYALGGWGWAN